MRQTKLYNVAKLLDFGANCLSAQKLDVMKMKGSRKLVFPMIIAAHNYSEGIYDLCKANRTHPSFSLLRSLLENLINIKFLISFLRKHHYIIFLNVFLSLDFQPLFRWAIEIINHLSRGYFSLCKLLNSQCQP